MDDAPSNPPDAVPPGGAQPSIGAWLIASLTGTLGLALVAAHVPPRMRLIGLFSVVFGILVGSINAYLAARMSARQSQQRVRLVAAALAFVGLIGTQSEIFRLESFTRKSRDDALAARLLAGMNKQNPDGTIRPLEQSTLTAFRDHLARRVRQFGNWPPPWPELFWLLETVVGAAASFWIAGRFTGCDVTTSSFTSVLSP